MRRGANLEKICDEVYQSYPLSRARLLRHIYRHFRLTHQDQIAYFWLKKADYARTGADCSDAEGLIDHIRAIAAAVIAEASEEQIRRNLFHLSKDPLPFRKVNFPRPGAAKNTLEETDAFLAEKLARATQL